MTSDEIRRLDDGTLLAILDNRKPFLDRQRRYYEDAHLLAMTQKTMNVHISKKI